MKWKYIDNELARGDESLESAEILLHAGKLLDAMSRAYYATLHYTRGMLLVKDVTPKSHHGVFLQFGKNYIKNGEVDILYSKIFGRLMKFREEADYTSTASFSKLEVETALENVRQFRQIAVKILGLRRETENLD